MKIDAYCHLFTPRYYDRVRKRRGYYIEKRVNNVPALVDLELRFRIMDAFEEYAQVLTMVAPPLEILGDAAFTTELARIGNDELAELVEKYPDRFPAAIAVLPLNDVEASLREIDRALGDLGLKGVHLFTHVNGKPLDAPEFEPLFEKMASYDLPIFMHPARGEQPPDYPALESSQYEIWYTFGWPFATAAAMTHLVFSGVFDRYPNLKIVTHHMGGMVPYFEERIRGAYDQYGVRSQVDREQFERLQKTPLEYFRMFYADTALYGSVPAMECGLAFFGAERVLFATDMPFDAEGGYRYVRRTLRAMEAMRASPREKQLIYAGNIRRLLRLD